MKRKRSIVFLAAFCAVIIVLIMFFIRGTDVGNRLDDYHSEESPYRNADLRVEIIPVLNNTYGYNILMNGRILIHQPHIPALPGNEGFMKKEDAQTVAEFLIHKIRQNIFPPSVSVEELDSLGVL